MAGPAMPLFLTAEELGSVRLEACKASSTFTSQEWVASEPGSALDAATKRLLRWAGTSCCCCCCCCC